MTVKELIEALKLCANQNAEVLFWDRFDDTEIYSVIEQSEYEVLLNG